jgi:hypothetical protein
MIVYIILAIVVLIFIFSDTEKESLENTVPIVNPQPVLKEEPVEKEQQEPVAFSFHENQFATIGDREPVTHKLTSEDLLPVYSENDKFLKENPVAKLLKEQNFLQAGHHFGINTVVQSNKIPYLDVRSVPPIPKKDLGPFNNSSYEQPMGADRRFLEIGY